MVSIHFDFHSHKMKRKVIKRKQNDSDDLTVLQSKSFQFQYCINNIFALSLTSQIFKKNVN